MEDLSPAMCDNPMAKRAKYLRLPDEEDAKANQGGPKARTIARASGSAESRGANRTSERAAGTRPE
eukprot:3715652-Alexandrium_andersonii.AAC.1